MAFDETKAKIVRAGDDMPAGTLIEVAEDGNAYPASALARVQYWPLGLLGPYRYEFQGYTRQTESSPEAVTWETRPVGPVRKVPAPFPVRLFYYLIYKWYIKLHRRRPEEKTNPDKWELISRTREGGGHD